MSDSIIPPTNSKSKPFDITPPGQSPPSSSSRPVIITNQPEQSDPMLKEPAPLPDLNPKDLSPPGAEPKEKTSARHGLTPEVKSELKKLQKNPPAAPPNLVTVSSEAIEKKPVWKKAAIIGGIMVVLLGLIYYYR
jgi:hypothetical protein